MGSEQDSVTLLNNVRDSFLLGRLAESQKDERIRMESMKDLKRSYYGILNRGGLNLRENMVALRELVLERGIPDDYPSDNSVVDSKPEECSLRGTIWKILLGALHVDAIHYISLLKEGPCKSDTKIRNDTFRTFKIDAEFWSKVKESQLTRVLNAFVRFYFHIKESNELSRKRVDSKTASGKPHNRRSPDGYYQGMNILLAPFLFVMPEIDSFASFSCLILKHCPRYATQNLDGAHDGCTLVDRCLATLDAALHKHITSKITAQIFAFPIVLTLLASLKPLREVLKVWDAIFAFGVHFHVVLYTVQLMLLRDRLLQEHNPYNLQRMVREEPIDGDLLVHCALRLINDIPLNLFNDILDHPIRRHPRSPVRIDVRDPWLGKRPKSTTHAASVGLKDRPDLFGVGAAAAGGSASMHRHSVSSMSNLSTEPVAHGSVMDKSSASSSQSSASTFNRLDPAETARVVERKLEEASDEDEDGSEGSVSGSVIWNQEEAEDVDDDPEEDFVVVVRDMLNKSDSKSESSPTMNSSSPKETPLFTSMSVGTVGEEVTGGERGSLVEGIVENVLPNGKAVEINALGAGVGSTPPSSVQTRPLLREDSSSSDVDWGGRTLAPVIIKKPSDEFTFGESPVTATNAVNGDEQSAALGHVVAVTRLHVDPDLGSSAAPSSSNRSPVHPSANTKPLSLESNPSVVEKDKDREKEHERLKAERLNRFLAEAALRRAAEKASQRPSKGKAATGRNEVKEKSASLPRQFSFNSTSAASSSSQRRSQSPSVRSALSDESGGSNSSTGHYAIATIASRQKMRSVSPVGRNETRNTFGRFTCASCSSSTLESEEGLVSKWVERQRQPTNAPRWCVACSRIRDKSIPSGATILERVQVRPLSSSGSKTPTSDTDKSPPVSSPSDSVTSADCRPRSLSNRVGFPSPVLLPGRRSMSPSAFLSRVIESTPILSLVPRDRVASLATSSSAVALRPKPLLTSSSAVTFASLVSEGGTAPSRRQKVSPHQVLGRTAGRSPANTKVSGQGPKDSAGQSHRRISSAPWRY